MRAGAVQDLTASAKYCKLVVEVILMVRIGKVVQFFSEVVNGEGFILSEGTCNTAHVGPKIADVLVKLDPDSFYDIMREWNIEYYDHRWGKDLYLDSDLLTDLWNLMYHITNVSSVYVKGLEDYSWGYSDADGALLGWFKR